MDLTTAQGQRFFDEEKDKEIPESGTPEQVPGRQKRIDIINAQQEQLFANIKSHVARGLIETVQEFSKRFDAKCGAVEARI